MHAGHTSQHRRLAVLAAGSADTPPLPVTEGEKCDSLRHQVAELQQKVDRLEALADGRTTASPAGAGAHLGTLDAKLTRDVVVWAAPAMALMRSRAVVGWQHARAVRQKQPLHAS